jgi:uncharacterized protein involved in exopolysaccharide biosynthesis
MTSTTSPAIQPLHILHVLRTYRRRWLVPAIAVLLLAAAYALVHRPWWEASQALALRNEAANNQDGLGRFRALDDMKVTQETILELAKSQTVLTAALRDVGPASGQANSQWPGASDVIDLRTLIALTPPKGTEFGRTEIFYLKVKDRDRSRAQRLVSAVARHLQASLQELRRAKAQSMFDELAHSAKLAEADLARSIEKLSGLEQSIGSDLADLRMLDLSATGDSDLRRKLVTLDEEIRAVQATRQSSQELHALLLAARQDPNQLLATPNRLLESQPALRKLKEGLIDAQLRTSQLLGAMTEKHPQVVVSRVAEAEIRQQLFTELEAATRGVEVELRLADGRLEMLQADRAAVTARLDKLAGLRAEYSSLVNDMRHRTTLVEKAQQTLAEARASQAGASTASLLTFVDRPETGDQPLGPSAALILLAGLAGGLMCGFGVVFLTAPLEEAHSSQANEAPSHARNGRSLSLSEALAKVAAL